MGARVAVIAGISVALLAQATGSVAADRDGQVTVRVIVTGRLLDTAATVRVYDEHRVQDVRVDSSRTVKVSTGRVTFVPLPIAGEEPSTARVQQLTVGDGATVRFRYRRDTSSRQGPLAPMAVGSDGGPVTGHGWVASPDRASVAFVSDDPSLPGGPGLFVSDLATGDVRRMGDSGSRVFWSPDSRRISFVTASDEVIVADVETVEFRVVSARSDRAQWADDDHLVLSVCTPRNRCGIAVTTVSTLTTRMIVPAASRVRAWALSPDGRRALFESAHDPLARGLARSLYLVDVQNARTKVLSANTRGGAVWSPDSSKVAFRSAAGSGRSHVLVEDLRSGDVTTVWTAPKGRRPVVRWAPDSKVIALRTPGGGFVERLATGRQRPLIPRSVTVPHMPEITGLAFSPSGKRIAFRFGAGRRCLTDVLPYADLNCSNVLVRDLRNRQMVNVSTGESGLGWRGRDANAWSPVWLSEQRLLIGGPGSGSATHPMIKAVEWAPAPAATPEPQVPPWCDPNRYWWSC